ncbi:MAG: peptidase, partial [Alphaproteobacteria bacterium]|nr:peptidase [Alphaproteobacteria bacterium]
MKRVTAALLCSVLLCANGEPDAAAMFGARENVQSISLSPDGGRIAYIVPTQGQGSRLYAIDIGATSPKVVTSVDGEQQRMNECDWVSSARLVCSTYSVINSQQLLVNASRLVALDIDGKNARILGQRDSSDQVATRLWGGGVVDWLPGQDNQLLMEQAFIPEDRSGTLLARTGQGLGVVQIDTANGHSRTVEGPRPAADHFISDGDGQIRLMRTLPPRGSTGQDSNSFIQYYRTAGSKDWVRLGSYDRATGLGAFPVAVDGKANVAYVLQSTNGRTMLYKLALDGSNKSELVVSHDQVDIDGVIRLGRRGRVIGAVYTTEKRQSVYFDPALKALAAGLSKALPNSPLMNFVGASDDETKLLVWAGGDSDPGTYYLLDRPTKKLVPLIRSRPELEGVKLASVRAVSYRAADGTMIPAYLTLPPGKPEKGLPTIVMPHGGPSARDEWGFDWLAQFYANRGYAVLQPNFRGSAGYGSQWFQTNGFQSWRIAIGDVNDAGRWLISQGIADPAKLAIVGWSYGGYAALQSAVVDPSLYKAIVAVAPVTDLGEARNEWAGFTNSGNVRDFFGTGPHIEDGSPARHAEAIRAPVLLFHGT